jgi:hypothetical protein
LRITLGTNRSYQVVERVDALAISLSEQDGINYAAGLDPSWQLDIWSESDEGPDYVGTINTVAARNGKFPTRLIAYAIAPGSRSWRIESTGPGPNPEAQIDATAELRARPIHVCPSGLGLGVYRPNGRAIINGHLATEVGSGTTAPLAASRVDFIAPIAFSGAFGSNESTGPAVDEWIMFFNARAVPANGTQPYEGLSFHVPAGGSFNFVTPLNGLFLSTGLTWAVSSTPDTLTLSAQTARVVTLAQW